MIELGDKVKDTVTEFEGIVIALSSYLHGCTRVGVKSVSLKDGIPTEAQWFDAPQLKIIARGVVEVTNPQKDTPGGPAHLIDPGPERPGD